MNTPRLPRPRIWNGVTWLAFATGLVLATAPVWNRLLFGFDPTLDQLLGVICMAPR